MGAGRGQTRRAQATALQPGRLMGVDDEKWVEFVFGSNSQGVSLRDYYCPGAKKQFGPKDLEKVVTELFADMVSVGAIVLPRGKVTADYAFRVTRKGRTDTLQINVNARPGATFNLKHFFDADRTLSDQAVTAGMARIAITLWMT